MEFVEMLKPAYRRIVIRALFVEPLLLAPKGVLYLELAIIVGLFLSVTIPTFEVLFGPFALILGCILTGQLSAYSTAWSQVVL